MKAKEYNILIWKWLGKLDHTSYLIHDLIGHDSIPNVKMIPYFISALEKFMAEDMGFDYVIEFSNDKLSFVKRKTTGFSHIAPERLKGDWGDLDKLEKRLRKKKFKEVTRIDGCSTIKKENMPQFLNTHFAALRASNSLTLQPYYDRLVKL